MKWLVSTTVRRESTPPGPGLRNTACHLRWPVLGSQALDCKTPERQVTVASATGHVPWGPGSCGGGGAQREELHQLGRERGKVHQDALLRLCRRRG